MIEADKAQIALERVHQAKQFAQALTVMGEVFQLDQQLLTTWKLLGSIQTEILKQVERQVGGARQGHDQSPQVLSVQYRKRSAERLCLAD